MGGSNSLPLAKRISKFMLSNIVFFIAAIVAVITCFFVPPDKEYIGYFDFKTLVSLLCMMLVICALRDIYFFRILARKIVKLFKTTQSAITALIFITYFGSMLIANDMALLTFLPLSLIVLKSCGKTKYLGYTFVLQTLAANLGGMLTPFGNPQNLYLYNYYNIPNGEFFRIMAIPFVVATVIIFIGCMLVKREPLASTVEELPIKLNIPRTLTYLVMFAYSIILVFRVVPYWTGLFIVPIMLLLDRRAFASVDYMLLLTFCMFFIFSGNLARIDVVQTFLSKLVNSNTLLTSILAAQFISNVPTAVLLSNFTANYKALLYAVNICSAGTLVSSMASLITFRHYCVEDKRGAVKYLLMFHGINFCVLGILILTCYWL